MLVIRLLNKLLQDAQQTKKAYYSQVERACSSALQDIRLVDSDENDHKILKQKSVTYEQEEEDAQDTSADLLVGEEVRPQVSVDSEKFFVPFELACKGDVAKITITALDAIQKLVAYGEIIGDYPDPKSPTRRFIDRIVETICSCHLKLEADEGVELQIIKALLTIVTSEQVQVHESTLLLILRTCCIIHLTTKSAVNRRTARAMLTQMLHSIFHRMEIAAEELNLQKEKKGKQSVDAEIDFAAFQDWEAQCAALVEKSFSGSILSVASYNSKNVENNLHNQYSTNRSNSRISMSDQTDSTMKDINQNSEKITTNEPNEQINHEISADEENVSSVSLQQENEVDHSGDSTNPFITVTNKNSQFSYDEGNAVSALQKDAFLSLWTLTRLALKPLSGREIESKNDKHSTDAFEGMFDQAILAFHLLKEILEKSGKVFKESPIFVNAMKNHLFNAMHENPISTNGDIFKLMCEILMIVITKFADIMSQEIQALMEAIIFPVLEDTASYPPSYLKVVLQALKSISSNLACFVHLYTAYNNEDGASESRPFKRTISCVCKIINEHAVNEEIAVEVLTNLLKSMSAACPKLEDNSQSDTGIEPERLRRFSSFEEPLKFDDDMVQKLELEGKDFLTCLYIFLANIDIPCDVFKLDWSVQKLAQKMTDTSSVNSFRTETADCWYALVYASMSLIADIKITNCQGKSKMSRNQFVKLNRAINDCEPLDETFLTSVYDEIEETFRRDKEATSSDQAKWLKMIGKDEKEILDVIKYILESTSLLRSHFSLSKQLKHVKRMIKICGTSFLTALINALQSSNDAKLTDMCLDGIHSGIRVACILGLDNEREAYVQALAKLSVTALEEIRKNHINSKVVTKKTSTLTMTEHGVTKTVVTTTTEMKCRSVDIVLTLLDVGIAEGNHLGGSWLHILKFMSQLLSTPLLAESRNSSRSGSPVPPAPVNNVPNSNSGWAAWAGSLKESLEKKLWDPATTALHPSVKESIATSVEKVFKRSEMLTGDAMTDFFQALCQVSLHDMMNSETPSKHLMYERINEVADGNFYRPALQWSQIWQVVADYFCHLACSSKEEISTLAIESIQKLVLKLLKKETLNGYRFQNHYFAPFKVIIANTRSSATRESVLGFVETVISLHSDLLLSGWIAILSILVTNMLNHNNDKDAAADSFRVLQHIVDKCQKGEVNLKNSFGSIVKSLMDIAGNLAPTLEMSEQAFRLLTQFAEIPFKRPELLMEENDDKLYRVWARGWKPILSELSAIIVSHPEEDASSGGSSSWDIKTKALITLFEVIKSYGSSFEKEWWNSVFEVLFNIFNDIKSQEKQDLLARQLRPPSSSTSTSPSSPDGSYKFFYCYYYVQFAIFDVYIQYYDATGSYAFDELLKHLQWCICQDHEQIALSGVSCLQQLVVTLGKRFSVSQWDSILNVFQTICKPQSEFTRRISIEGQSQLNGGEIPQTPAIRAVIHLELLKIMDRVIFPGGLKASPTVSNDDTQESKKENIVTSDDDCINPLLTNSQVSIILEILSRSHEIAKEHCIMGSCRESKEQINGRRDSTTVIANFIPHETLSLQTYWKVLFAMFKTDSSLNKYGIGKDALWEMIQQSCLRSCGYFVTIQSHEHRDAWADLLCFSLSNILKLPRPNFEAMTSELYPYFCEMLEIEVLDGKICGKLREYLLVVGKHYGVASCGDITGGNNGALKFSGAAFDTLPKTCNSSANIQFQRTCVVDTFSETVNISSSKDFQ